MDLLKDESLGKPWEGPYYPGWGKDFNMAINAAGSQMFFQLLAGSCVLKQEYAAIVFSLNQIYTLTHVLNAERH